MESLLTVGDRDQYELSTKLGSGAFGEVFLGYEKETKREFAIKVEPADAKHP
jgi:serine/threonine protein kinase